MQLSHITYELGEKKLSLHDIAALNHISSSEALIYQKIMGLKSVPRNLDSNVYQQLLSVINKFLQEIKISREDIKYIVFAHTSEFVAPISLPILQNIVHHYGFKNALAFGSTVNKCAGAFQLLKITKQLFENLELTDKILLLIADIAFTKLLYSIQGTTVLGDAATVVLLENENNLNRLIDCVIQTDGRFASAIYASSYEFAQFQFFYVPTLSQLISDIVEKNNLTFDQIKYIFPNNVNILSWRLIAEKLKIPIEKIYLKNVARTAHCFGSDPFINLHDAMHSQKLKKDDYYLLVTAGLGATFAAILLQH